MTPLSLSNEIIYLFFHSDDVLPVSPWTDVISEPFPPLIIKGSQFSFRAGSLVLDLLLPLRLTASNMTSQQTVRQTIEKEMCPRAQSSLFYVHILKYCEDSIPRMLLHLHVFPPLSVEWKKCFIIFSCENTTKKFETIESFLFIFK